MRAAGMITLLLAIVLGIAAIGSYIDDSSKRDKALNQLPSLRADSPLRSSYLEEIARRDAGERNDEVLGEIAAVLLIVSLAMLSRSAPQASNGHGRPA